MIKVTLQLENGLASASPDGLLHLTLPVGSTTADLRRQAIDQLGSPQASQRLAHTPLAVGGQILDEDAVLTATQLDVSLAPTFVADAHQN